MWGKPMFIAILPAYNEEKMIGSVVRSLFGYVDEIVVVDDGSRDSTAQLARDAGATVLVHKINRGQGAALETGHEYARRIGADYVIHFDADGQFHVEDILPALAHLQYNNAEVLFGSRFLGKNTEIPFFKKQVVLPIAKIINMLFTRAYLSDAHNGFRILSKKALQEISIEQDRMAHATEIPAQVKKKNLAFVEFPVQVSYHEYGQGSAAGFMIIRDLVIGKFVK